MKFRLFANHKRAPKFERGAIALLARDVIREEGKTADNISVVLVDDNFLLDVNRKFLNHNYRTDVITFDLGEDGIIEGEVYISIDRAQVQARRFKVSLERETVRLVVHGILHLAGWDDKTRAEKIRMRKRENVFIQRFYELRKRV